MNFVQNIKKQTYGYISHSSYATLQSHYYEENIYEVDVGNKD